MTQSKFIRWSGLAAILTGLLVVTGEFLELTGNQQEWIYMLLDVALLVALTGVYLFQRHQAGIWGTLGYFVALVGTLTLLLDFSAEFLYPVGASILGAGLILLAISALKAGKLPRWAPVLWIIAPVIGLPGLFWQALSVPFISTAAAVFFASGFIGVGYQLWTPAT